jgi:hypothetical protein
MRVGRETSGCQTKKVWRALTHWRPQREGQVRTQRECDQVKGTNWGETSEGIEKVTEGKTHPLETAAFPSTHYEWGNYQCVAEVVSS